MAYRAPFKVSGSDLQVMSTSDITNIHYQAIYQYSLDPSVTLSVVGSNGNLNAMIDRRYAAGAASLSNSGFAADSADITAVDTTWDVIDQTVASTVNTWDDSNVNIAYPVYLNSSNEIQAMTREDFYDTFIDPAITAWYARTQSSGNFSGGGQYYIFQGNGAVSGYTLVSNNPVFTNTQSADAIRQGALPETLDQPTAGTSYYLYLKDTSDTPVELPFKIDADGNIQQYTEANFNSMLQYHMRHAVTSRAGSYIRYQIEDNSGTLGRTSGSGMSDTHYASFTRRTYQTGDNYYTQEVPSGSLTTRSTYYLKIVNDNDISGGAAASYTASASASNVDEGDQLRFILTMNNVPDGTQIPYAITGITADDISSGSLSGTVTVVNNQPLNVLITLAEDGTTENEVATCTFTTPIGDRTASASIGDVAPVGPWPSTIPFAWGTERREVFGASQGAQAQAFSRVTFYNQVGSQNRIQITSVSGTNAAQATPANGYIELGDTYAGATIEVRYRITNASYSNVGSVPSDASGAWVTVADGTAKQFNWLADAILQGQATNDVSTINANTVDFEVRISKNGQDTVIRTSPVNSLGLRARVSGGEIE